MLVIQIQLLEGGDLLGQLFVSLCFDRLLGLHCVDHDMVEQFEFFGVVILAWLDALGQEVVCCLVDDLLGVALFVGHPADELLVVIGGEFLFCRQFANLVASLGDGFDVLLELAEFEFCVENAAGHLAVRAGEIGDKDGENANEYNGCFHGVERGQQFEKCNRSLLTS